MNPFRRFQTKARGSRSNEYEQGIFRVLVVGLLIVYCAIVFPPDGFSASELASLGLSVLYFAVAAVLQYSVLRSPRFSPVRVVIAAIADVAATSYYMYLAGPFGAIVFFVFLQIIIGNGVRYGLRYLFLCQGLSLVGFSAVMLASDYWRSHAALSTSLLIGLIVLPMFTTVLVRRLHDALRRADEASQAKSQFLARMSHELRTPLHAIVSTTDLLNAAPYTPEQRVIFQVLRDSIDTLLRRVDQVLDLSKIEAGRIDRIEAPFRLHTILDAYTSVFQTLASQKGLRLTAEIAPGVPAAVVGDAQHLGDILQNLIGNAVKFTAEGGVSVRVSAAAPSDANGAALRLRFEVRDTGIGIAPEFIPRLFQRFVQEDGGRTRHFDGSGLGTAIAKELVQLLGGTIGADSVKGVGSTFWFELPLQRCSVPSDSDASDLAIAPAASSAISRRDHHILVADDNAINRMLIEKILVGAGYRVTSCANGDEALAALRGVSCDLAILDAHMPDKGGLEVVRELRSADRVPDAQLMVLTADATLATRRQCEALGLRYVAKPVRREVLLSAIDSLLNKHREAVEVHGAECRERQGVPLDETTVARIIAVGDGKFEFARGVLMLFCAQATDIVARIEAHVSSGDLNEVVELVHKLEGSAGTVGATTVVAACRALKAQSCGADRMEQVKALRSAVADAIGEIREKYDRPTEIART